MACTLKEIMEEQGIGGKPSKAPTSLMRLCGCERCTDKADRRKAATARKRANGYDWRNNADDVARHGEASAILASANVIARDANDGTKDPRAVARGLGYKWDAVVAMLEEVDQGKRMVSVDTAMRAVPGASLTNSANLGSWTTSLVEQDGTMAERSSFTTGDETTHVKFGRQAYWSLSFSLPRESNASLAARKAEEQDGITRAVKGDTFYVMTSLFSARMWTDNGKKKGKPFKVWLPFSVLYMTEGGTARNVTLADAIVKRGFTAEEYREHIAEAVSNPAFLASCEDNGIDSDAVAELLTNDAGRTLIGLGMAATWCRMEAAHYIRVKPVSEDDVRLSGSVRTLVARADAIASGEDA